MAKSKANYNGCSVESARGRLRLRFWADPGDGTRRHVSRKTGKADTPANRNALRTVARMVGILIKAGKTLADIDVALGRPVRIEKAAALPGDITLRAYAATWLEYQQPPRVRKELARHYKSDLDNHILPSLGDTALSELRSLDVRGLQGELEAKELSTKTVRNIISGTFRALIRDAKADELIGRDIFGGLRWAKSEPPGPDPFTIDEARRIVAWFRMRDFKFRSAPGIDGGTRAHAPFAAYVHTAFWTGLRPSELAGLYWADVELDKALLHVRRSRHRYSYGEPKTTSARRTVQLFPFTVSMLLEIRPAKPDPKAPVFLNTDGRAIEPNTLLRYWHECLEALKIRDRDLYATKDTYVTTALSLELPIPWIEQQTGVTYATLRKHYGKYMVSLGRDVLPRFAAIEPALLSPILPVGTIRIAPKPVKSRAAVVREGGLEPRRHLGSQGPRKRPHRRERARSGVNCPSVGTIRKAAR